MTTPTLLPCPFCGGTASLDDSVGGAFVSCDLCEAQGPFVKYEGFPDPPTHDEFLQLVFQAKQKAEVTAAAAWNQRSAWQPIETALGMGRRSLQFGQAKGDLESSGLTEQGGPMMVITA